MSKPMALVYYANLMPGSQLSNKILDLGYRVRLLPDLALLAETCQTEKPLVVVAELVAGTNACEWVAKMKKDPATQHIPVLAFSRDLDEGWRQQAASAGVSLLVGNAAITEHLPRMLDQVLQIE
jgi:CheY-like chemotaxis protein